MIYKYFHIELKNKTPFNTIWEKKFFNKSLKIKNNEFNNDYKRNNP